LTDSIEFRESARCSGRRSSRHPQLTEPCNLTGEEILRQRWPDAGRLNPRERDDPGVVGLVASRAFIYRGVNRRIR